MVSKETIEKAYEAAKARYAEVGVDTDAVLEKLQNVKNGNKNEETVTILCQLRPAKKFEKRCGQLLWKTLWRMWKTHSYQQVFRLFTQSRVMAGKQIFLMLPRSGKPITQPDRNTPSMP